ncbi:MAG: poly-gamma-glutamate system protein [Proteobacteria bacterium]|nr:poly-gamma-glutamate system protein [Pseudomonadota bacterium]
MAGYKLKGRRPLFGLAVALVLVWGLVAVLKLSTGRDLSIEKSDFRTKMDLAHRMKQGMVLLRKALDENGVAFDPFSDPNRTGFIGEELTPLTTTLGSLVSKRTTTNPDVAPLIHTLLLKAGVGEGDVVAVAASGSFPALIFATMMAVEAVGAKPLVVVSVGSSTWGANRPNWTWLDMERLFHRSGLVKNRSRFVTPGGPDDQGSNLFEESKGLFLEAARRNGIPKLESKSLEEAIERRMAIYTAERPALFVNIGGSHPSLGGCPHGHLYPPGLIEKKISCSHSERGLIVRFQERGIPVVNLLDIPALAVAHGIAVDPVPLPKPGQSPVYFSK